MGDLAILANVLLLARERTESGQGSAIKAHGLLVPVASQKNAFQTKSGKIVAIFDLVIIIELCDYCITY